MYAIDNPSSVAARPAAPAPGTPGWFSKGNPAAAQEATIVEDWWCNLIQDEILTVIEQAGLVPDKNNHTQLWEALQTLYGSTPDLGSTYLTIVSYDQWQAPKLTSGSATAYTATYSTPPTAIADGQTHLIEFHVANGAGATLNINARAAVPIHYYAFGAWRPIPPNLFGAGAQHRCSYHAVSAAYRLTGWKDTTGDLVPTGRVAARAGTILGLGQAVDRVDYAGLFAAYGTTYGPGNGSTTFNLPDLRGRAVFGTDQGTGRITGAMTGTLGSVGGQDRQQYVVTATAASVGLTGTINVTGTAGTSGLDVHSLGSTSGDMAYQWSDGTTNLQVASRPHQHTIDIHGTVTADANVVASGSLAAGSTAGGGAVNGSTDNRSNMPPAFVGNYAICL
jgi:microcystin-dependent protein